MAFNAPVKPSFEREIIPAGSYHAICYALFDLGTRDNEYMGQTTKRREIVLIFEIPELRINYKKDDEELEGPKVISKRYNWSMHEKSNLRHDMELWRGKEFTELEAKDFDFEKIPGANGIVHIIHRTKSNGDKYAAIESITKLMKGMDNKQPENSKSFWTFIAPYVDELGFHFPKTMPDWVIETIKKSDEYGYICDTAIDLPPEPSAEEEKDESIPF